MDRWTSLGGYFLIGLAIIAPYGWFTIRRIGRTKQARRRIEHQAAQPPVPATEVSVLVAQVAAEIADLGDDEPFTVWIPDGLTVNGQPLPDGIARLVVIDNLRRSGMTVESLSDDTILCRGADGPFQIDVGDK